MISTRELPQSSALSNDSLSDQNRCQNYENSPNLKFEYRDEADELNTPLIVNKTPLGGSALKETEKGSEGYDSEEEIKSEK